MARADHHGEEVSDESRLRILIDENFADPAAKTTALTLLTLIIATLESKIIDRENALYRKHDTSDLNELLDSLS